MFQINNPAECCGCTACASICAHNAISMEPDVLGFLYPKVNTKVCINCGLCEKVCAFNDNYETDNYESPKSYGVRHKDINVVDNSRSGGLFTAISDYVLANNGIVYGCGYGEGFKIIHKRAVSKEERDEFRGSKYVQSDLTGIFRAIRDDLRAGRHVLFVGTGCQTAGLNSFISKKLRERLLLVDIICHGVPSPYLWRDYLKLISTKYNKKILRVDFRDKHKFGWEAHRESFLLEGFSEPVCPDSNFYRKLFFRKSCEICHFCNLRRPSDITIGDFWGWDRQKIDLNNDNKGINLLLINTPYGDLIFNEIKHDLIIFKADKSCFMQPNLSQPTKAHPFRIIMEQDYVRKGFDYVINHDYDNPSIIDRIRRKLHTYNL